MQHAPSTSLRAALWATTLIASPALAQEVIDIGTIVVNGASYETEGSDSYTTHNISVGEKSSVGPRQVPQSTSIVTHKQIEDGGYTALEEALADVPGIMILRNNVGRSSLYSRGYEFDYLYFDGLPAPVSSIYGTQPDLSIVDHVEILKGPAGLFIGTGEPAGSINMRLKQAAATETTGYGTLSADSNGQLRAEIDVADKLNADGTLRGRLVGARSDGDSFEDGIESAVTSLYGTLAWDVTPDTELSFSLSHMQRDMVPHNGLPSYADGSLIYLDPAIAPVFDWNRFENQTDDAVLAVEHFFTNGGRVKFSLRASHQESNFLYGYTSVAANADNTVDRFAWLARDFDQDSLALDLHTELPFTLGRWQGNVILGADYQKIDSTMYQARGAIVQTLDLDAWDSAGISAPAVAYSTRTDSDITSRGLYSQVRLSPISNLTFIGGARLSWYEGTTTTTTLATDAQTTSRFDESAHITPFLGATYDLNESTTLYASFSEIFEPQSVTDQNGALLDPVQGQQVEIGVKAELAAGLNVSAALFDLRQKNRPVQDISGTFYIAQEEVRSRGLEIEAAGEVTDQLHLSAGYTYTDTEYLSGANEGDTFSSITPENIFKISAMYDIDQGALEGWSFGGRLTSVSGFSSNTVNATGYGVVDLMASRRFDNGVNMRLGIDNLFDRAYYERVGATGLFNFRGAPRTFKLSVTKSF